MGGFYEVTVGVFFVSFFFQSTLKPRLLSFYCRQKAASANSTFLITLFKKKKKYDSVSAIKTELIIIILFKCEQADLQTCRNQNSKSSVHTPRVMMPAFNFDGQWSEICIYMHRQPYFGSPERSSKSCQSKLWEKCGTCATKPKLSRISGLACQL